MAIASFKLDENWRKMQFKLDPKRFGSVLESELRRATTHSGQQIVGAIQRSMGSARYQRNAPLTILIKGNRPSLIDTGELRRAVTFYLANKQTVFVGVRHGERANGMDMVELAQILHEGARIRVTPHMRGLFSMLASVGRGEIDASRLTGRAAELANILGPRIGEIRPLRPTTNVIVIPPRRFIEDILRNRAIRDKIKANWEAALSRALLFSGQYD